jgi:hypothetical protein
MPMTHRIRQTIGKGARLLVEWLEEYPHRIQVLTVNDDEAEHLFQAFYHNSYLSHKNLSYNKHLREVLFPNGSILCFIQDFKDEL